ncbi:hypothetical protein ABZ840_11760 [Streptomyces sp. NPDC047117]|uniref:hypothetical protein n=1 Tax=Streptomyces sp. NPDC047117 TaxID=3155379 RepID=UPI00340F43E4
MGKALIAGVVTVLVMFGLAHFLWPDMGEPAQLIAGVVVGAIVGGVFRFSAMRTRDK